MTSLVPVFISLTLIVIGYMTLWFFIAILKKRNDVADIAWGLGFFVVTITAYLYQGIDYGRGLLVLALVALWAGRLSGHIYLRNKNKAEDYRYEAWRKEWGRWFYIRTYLQVFLLQGLLLIIVSSPAILAIISRGTNWNIKDAIGVIIWLIGFLFESIGDWQLNQFIKNPQNRGKLMRQGLWQYTRHPNYFGEVIQWWGIWIISLSVPFGWIGFVGPLTISFLILKVSGIPMLEKKMAENPEFEDYKKKTSSFFPLPPKK